MWITVKRSYDVSGKTQQTKFIKQEKIVKV